MAKPFANSQQYNGDLIDSYIMELQIGSTTDDGGLAQMRSIQLGKLKSYLKEGMGATFNYRGKYGTLPTDLAVGDSFVASLSFTVGGQTYEEGHLYAWNGTSWDDITDIFTQYAQQAEVDSINERLTEAEEKIDALSGFIFKGDATRATLPTASASNQGWVYYLTDESIYVASDGTQWVTVMSFVGQTIAEGDTTHAPSSDAVYKALAERDAKDADLQSQIVNTNAELDNVEALIGGEAQVENTDPTEGESLLSQSRLIHHANLLPNGNFGRVGARSVAWNSQINPIGATFLSVTITFNDGVYHISGTASSGGGRLYPLSSSNVDIVAGHKYLIYLSKIVDGITWCLSDYSDYSLKMGTVSPTIYEPSSSYKAIFGANVENGRTYNADVSIVFCDLTTMNMASLTTDQFRILFPASNYPYDEGHIYDLNPSGFRIRGINLWDEQYEIADISGATGEWMSGNFVCSKNKIRVFPNTTYCIASPNNQGVTNQQYVIYKYREDGSYIGYQWLTNQISTFTTDADCTYIYFRNNKASSTYNHDIQICDNSLPDAIKTTYHPNEEHTVDTPQISDGHYVNENCYDYVENVEEDGIVKGKKHSVVGSIDLGTLDWASYAYGNERTYYALLPTKKLRTNNGLSAVFSQSGYGSETYLPDKSFCFRSDSIIFFRDSSYATQQEFKSAMSGVMLYYELAEEEITDCEPLRSFPISDYSTVEPITPQTELVNRIDVPFSVKSVSANTLIEQITQNTADIAEEKTTRAAQVSALEKRVTNLELKTGDLLPVDYPSPTYGMNGVPANVEPYAEVSVLKGVGRAKNNQIERTINTGHGIRPVAFASYAISADGEVSFSTVSTTSRIGLVSQHFEAGHTYLFVFSAKKTSGNGYMGYHDGTSWIWNVVPLTSSYQTLVFMWSPTVSFDMTNSDYPFGLKSDEQNVTLEGFAKDFILTDLTVYFKGSIPSNAQTIDGIRQNYHELLEPSDYGTEVVFSTYEAVKSDPTGKNFMDISQYGLYELVAGISRYGLKRRLPAGTYTISGKASSGQTYTVGAIVNDSVSSSYNVVDTFSQTFTLSAEGYIAIWTPDSVATLDWIMLNTGSSALPWEEYKTDTLTLPEPVTLKEAGSASEKYYPESGRVTHPLGEFIFDGVTGVSDKSTAWRGNSYAFRLTVAKATELDIGSVTNWFAGGYLLDSNLPMPIKTFYVYRDSTQTVLYINHDNNTMGMTAFVEYLQSNPIHFFYEKATPSPDTYVDPILDPYVKVEPNGTVKPVQSQSPEVDSAMTVEYMES